MDKEHWFDSVHKAVFEATTRRQIARSLAMLLPGLLLGDAAGAVANKKRGGGNKKKGGNNQNKKGKPKPHPPARCGQDACAAEWPDDDGNRNECELKCGRCRIGSKFCIVEGNPNVPDNLATCCFEHQKCCADAGSQSGMRCVDTENDRDNCGNCAHQCEDGQVCRGGSCGCEDSNCGGCGDGPPCTTGQVCCDGECCGHPNSPRLRCCDGECIDTWSDVNHCDGCNNRCAVGMVCSDGLCQTVAPCPPGTSPCGLGCVWDSQQFCCANKVACRHGMECCPLPDGTHRCTPPPYHVGYCENPI